MKIMKLRFNGRFSTGLGRSWTREVGPEVFGIKLQRFEISKSGSKSKQISSRHFNAKLTVLRTKVKLQHSWRHHGPDRRCFRPGRFSFASAGLWSSPVPLFFVLSTPPLSNSLSFPSPSYFHYRFSVSYGWLETYPFYSVELWLSAPQTSSHHHGAVQNEQDLDPAGHRYSIFLARINYWFVFWHLDRTRLSSDNGFLGYAVHSLALVADSFHMVRHHLRSCSSAETNQNSWTMSYPCASDYGPWRSQTGRPPPTLTPMA